MKTNLKAQPMCFGTAVGNLNMLSGITMRLKSHLLSHIHQIKGQWGHERRRRFSLFLAASPKGSMNAEMLKGYLQHVSQVYPDKDDVDKKEIFGNLIMV